MPDTVYVSITGLRVKHPLWFPRFLWHAVRAMSQAQRADGCLSAEARTINGIKHTRSVWRDRDAMMAFVHSEAHAKAIRAFTTIATGKTFGFESVEVPDWQDVHQLWLDKAREYDAS